MRSMPHACIQCARPTRTRGEIPSGVETLLDRASFLSHSWPTNIFTLVLHVKQSPLLLLLFVLLLFAIVVIIHSTNLSFFRRQESEDAQRLREHHDGHAKSGDAWLPPLHSTSQYNTVHTLRRLHGSSDTVVDSQQQNRETNKRLIT